jgi:DNA polymerase III sliding clamp (beta) subunit (PCNA family)
MNTIKLLSAVDLKNRFKKIKPFMSTEETRYYLCGVYFEYENRLLKATATNGHILCTMEWELAAEDDGISSEPFKIICPSSAVNNLIKIISAKKASDMGVLMHVSDDLRSIEFDFFDYKYKTNTVDGSYPNCSNVIPKGKESLQKGLNASYLVDVLKALNNSPVDIEVDDSTNAASQPHLFSSKDEDGIKCVIIPMRVQCLS